MILPFPLDPHAIPALSELTFLKLGSVSNLQTLGLADNALTSIPAQIGQLTSLTVFHLRGNKLTQLPLELFNLTQLVSLTLSQNGIKTISAEVSRLVNLHTLTLEYALCRGHHWNKLVHVLIEPIRGELSQVEFVSGVSSALARMPSQSCPKRLGIFPRLKSSM